MFFLKTLWRLHKTSKEFSSLNREFEKNSVIVDAAIKYGCIDMAEDIIIKNQKILDRMREINEYIGAY